MMRTTCYSKADTFHARFTLEETAIVEPKKVAPGPMTLTRPSHCWPPSACRTAKVL